MRQHSLSQWPYEGAEQLTYSEGVTDTVLTGAGRRDCPEAICCKAAAAVESVSNPGDSPCVQRAACLQLSSGRHSPVITTVAACSPLGYDARTTRARTHTGSHLTPRCVPAVCPTNVRPPGRDRYLTVT